MRINIRIMIKQNQNENKKKIKKEIIIRNIREYNDNNINMESKPLKMKIN